MLINLKIENWMSYRDSSEITMVATREQHHGGRVPKVKRIQTRILPIVVVFGGNASGKTNLFKALGFAQYMITQAYRMGPDDRIPVEPFLLDEKSRLSPTSRSAGSRRAYPSAAHPPCRGPPPNGSGRSNSTS